MTCPPGPGDASDCTGGPSHNSECLHEWNEERGSVHWLKVTTYSTYLNHNDYVAICGCS